MNKLFILGAGVSVDFGFPTGMELLETIDTLWRTPSLESINFYNFVFKAIKKISIPIPQSEVESQIQKLSYRLYYSGAESIDNFLSTCAEDIDVHFGKLTVLDIILKKEQSANLRNKPSSLFKWRQNWLRLLFKKEFLFGSKDELIKKLDQEKIKFITFNYDRALEYFIFTALRNYYTLSAEEEKEIFNKISFYHVYGKLAPLDWETTDPNEALRFGEDSKDSPLGSASEKLYRFSLNIKVINEDRTSAEDTLKKCKELICGSDRVYILGFGFQDFNYKLLGIDECKKEWPQGEIPPNKFFYTTYGLSKAVQNEVAVKFGRNIYGERAQSSDSTIYDYMLHNY